MGVCNYLKLKNIVLDLSKDLELKDWLHNHINVEDVEGYDDAPPSELIAYPHICNLSHYLLDPNDSYSAFDWSDIENCLLDLTLSFKCTSRQMEAFVYFLKDKIKSGTIYYKFDDISIQVVNYKDMVGSNEFVFYKESELNKKDLYIVTEEDIDFFKYD